MQRSHVVRFRYLSALWLSGAAVLALATWASFRLGLSSATAACVYLVIIVLLSLLDSFISSAIFSILAVCCLDYFFIEPRYAFDVANAQDFAALVAFLTTSIVITGLVRRLRRLAQAHSEQARLLDLTRDALFVRNLDNVITYWNRGSEDLYGWQREEALGRVSHQLLKTVFPAPLDEISGTLLRTGYWEGELVHTRRDGSQVTTASRWSLQRADNGDPLGTLETNNDITRRKQAESALRRIQETYVAEAQQLSHTGSFGWNPSTGKLYLSEEGHRIFGLDSKTVPSIEFILSLVHPDDLALVQRVIGRAAIDNQDFELEHRLRFPDGNVKHVRIVARALQSDAGATEFVGAMMDVTAIRAAERELHDTRTELAHVVRVTTLSELTATIAHEVNQSLGAVVANAEACLNWLDRDSPDLGEIRLAVQSISNDGHRASEVIRRVRTLVRKSDAQMAPFRLNEIVSETLNVLHHELLRYRVTVRLELSSDLPLVLGDRIQMQQVLLNLAMNSLEAMESITDESRELHIRSERDGSNSALVTVADCGIGIPPEKASGIFEAFVTTKATGLGMGLSISRSIVQAHGGRLWFSSNEPRGAVMQFTLPLHVPDARD
jgi:PAS domain S-box-containing protein